MGSRGDVRRCVKGKTMKTMSRGERHMRHLLKRAMLPFLGVLIAMLAGCASSQPAASVPTPADVSGTWMGSTVRGASAMTLVLSQTGTNVTGTFTGAGTIDGPIEGTVEGNTIRLRERSGFGASPTLNVKGDQITGVVGGTALNLRRVK